MSGPQFALQANPDQLRAAADRLDQIGVDLGDQGQALNRMPAGIPAGDWAGQARTAVMSEVTALGGQVATFRNRYALAASRIRKVATDVDDALRQIKGLNGSWQDADATMQQHQKVYDDPTAKAAAVLDTTGQASAARDLALHRAQDSHTQDQGRFSAQYAAIVEELTRQFASLGSDLASLVVSPIPASQVASIPRRQPWETGLINADPSWADTSGLRSQLPLTVDLEKAREAAVAAKEWKKLAAKAKPTDWAAIIEKDKRYFDDAVNFSGVLTSIPASWAIYKLAQRLPAIMADRASLFQALDAAWETSPLDSSEAIIKLAQDYSSILDASATWDPGPAIIAKAKTGGLPDAGAWGVAGRALAIAGIADDVVTISKPDGDSTAERTGNRVAAGANAAATATVLLSANAAADWIPVVGEVVMVGTGLYLAGDWALNSYRDNGWAKKAVVHSDHFITHETPDAIKSATDATGHFFHHIIG